MKNIQVESVIYYKHKASDYVKIHSHEMYECVFYKNGKGYCSAEGEIVNFEENTLVVIPPHVKHDEFTEIDSDVYIVLFNCDNSFEKEINSFFLNRIAGNRTAGLFEEMLYEQKKNSANSKTVINSLFSSILMFAESSKIHKVNSGDYSQLIESVKSFIKENYFMNIDFSQIAFASGYSYSRFRHIFSKYVGTSLHQFLLNCRLENAKKLLLDTDYKITKIKDLVGFSSNNQFCVFFRRETGLTPLEFRESMKKETDLNVVNFKENKSISNRYFIIDTDLDADCDDAGAIALADILMKQKFGKILCMTHCVGYLDATKNISAINKYYGVEVPVGRYIGEPVVPFSNKYVSKVNERFPTDNLDYIDSIKLLRQILATSEDKSITFISLGQFSNLEKLRTSKPDDISPLKGEELMNKKINKIVSMAGLFYDKKYTKEMYNNNGEGEYNIFTDIVDARNFVKHNKSVPHYFVDFFSGYDVITLDEFVKKNKKNNPVALAYDLFSQGGRASWDLITVLYAFLPNNKAFLVNGPGNISIDKKGLTTYKANKDGNGYYVRVTNKQYIKNYINNLFDNKEK